jgi:hypothetical protein
MPERAKVFEDRESLGDWRVERTDEDGAVEVAVFGGPQVPESAIRHANREYGVLDEIELEHYP